jgi:hypothetical protein
MEQKKAPDLHGLQGDGAPLPVIVNSTVGTSLSFRESYGGKPLEAFRDFNQE